MKYRIQPKLQIATGFIGLLVVIALGYLIEGSVDWMTAIAVAVGVALGMGFARSKNNPQKTHDSGIAGNGDTGGDGEGE